MGKHDTDPPEAVEQPALKRTNFQLALEAEKATLIHDVLKKPDGLAGQLHPKDLESLVDKVVDRLSANQGLNDLITAKLAQKMEDRFIALENNIEQTIRNSFSDQVVKCFQDPARKELIMKALALEDAISDGWQDYQELYLSDDLNSAWVTLLNRVIPKVDDEVVQKAIMTEFKKAFPEFHKKVLACASAAARNAANNTIQHNWPAVIEAFTKLTATVREILGFAEPETLPAFEIPDMRTTPSITSAVPVSRPLASVAPAVITEIPSTVAVSAAAAPPQPVVTAPASPALSTVQTAPPQVPTTLVAPPASAPTAPVQAAVNQPAPSASLVTAAPLAQAPQQVLSASQSQQWQAVSNPPPPYMPTPAPAANPTLDFPGRDLERKLQAACVYLRETQGTDYRLKGMSKIQYYNSLGEGPYEMSRTDMARALELAPSHRPGTGPYGGIIFDTPGRPRFPYNDPNYRAPIHPSSAPDISTYYNSGVNHTAGNNNRGGGNANCGGNSRNRGGRGGGYNHLNYD